VPPSSEHTTRALVLARGLGTRMRTGAADATLDPAQAAAADAGLKAMMPFGRPFLDYVLHSLADAGIDEVALVLGPEHERVREYYRAVSKTRIAVSFVDQAQPLGTADAVWSAREWAGASPFIVLNADNLYPDAVLAQLAADVTPTLPGFERDSLGLSLERIGTFALLETDPSGTLTRIVEKPGVDAMQLAGPRAQISMNIWRFDERIFQPCRDVPLSTRGERELPQAVGLAVERGIPFEVFPARGPVIDLSSRVDVAAVAQAPEGRQVNL
jgi:glucose-1-phosphate thymidylyltransferase